MNTKFFWLSILGVIISFAGGFMLANALNSSEISKLQAENASLEKSQNSQQNQTKGLDLTEEEITQRLKQAEENPDDFGFQKGLGMALYRYAAVKGDKALLEKVAKVFDRAYELNPNDYTVVVSIGNLYYDLGQLNKDEESNLKARKFYQEALKQNPKDTNVLTDFGLTHLLTKTPNHNVAIKEFEKALAIDPKNEKALTYVTQALADEKKVDEAKKYLDRLKEVNSANEKIVELEKMINQ